MLTHERAFDSPSIGKLKKLISASTYKPLPNDASESLKDLLANMLKVDVEKRFTVNQCLEHRWFLEHEDEEVIKQRANLTVDTGMISRLRKFRKGSKLRLCLLNILVKKIHLEKFADLDKQFNLIDSDGTGVINRQELEKALQS